MRDPELVAALSFTPARTSAAQPKQQKLADLGAEHS
jgi:hypothetical protein